MRPAGHYSLIMFRWFSPGTPLDSAAKQWVEERLWWLSDQFGGNVFLQRPVILPTDEFFPDLVDDSDESVRALFARVCRYMDVDSDLFDLQICRRAVPIELIDERGHLVPEAAGLYAAGDGRTIIQIRESELDDPANFVGTAAHELAHHRLLAEGRAAPEAFDDELLTDLTSIFFGFGIFLANSPRAWPSQFGNWPGTQITRPEYMTMPMSAYALAHTAWIRGERKPQWLCHLGLDARAAFKHALRYLFVTGDSTFAPHLKTGRQP